MTLSRQELLTFARSGAEARIAELESEIARIRTTFRIGKRGRSGRMAEGRSGGHLPGPFVNKGGKRRRRRRMSGEVRARLSKLAKERWAKAKKAGKKRL